MGRWRLLAATALALAVTAGCGRDSFEVQGTVITRPQNDCRYANDGTVTHVLAGVEVVFADGVSGDRYVTRTNPDSVTQYAGQCLQSAHFQIELPAAEAYEVQVMYFPAFGGLPDPVEVTLDELEQRDYYLDLFVSPGTGE
jgi:hypothetical protein